MKPSDEFDDAALGLQDRFVRGFAWLRKVAGLTQSAVAAAAGWHQPYVARLEDAASPLLPALSRLERYAQACGFTTVVVFVDKQSGAVARTLPLDEAGAPAAERLLPADQSASMLAPQRVRARAADWAARRVRPLERG